MEQTYTSEEIKQLLLYVKEMQEVNEDLRAGIIAMQAKLNNEEAKVKRLTLLIGQFTNVN
jgi:hypothetical protein